MFKFVLGWTLTVEHKYGTLLLTSMAPSTAQGNIKGLLGTYNMNVRDEFTLPNGYVLPSDMTDRDIYFKFGQMCKRLFVFYNFVVIRIRF